MASATIFSTLETPEVSPSLVTYWSNLLQQQLRLVAPYDDIQDDFLPASVTVDESILEAPRRRAADPNAAALAKQIAKVMYPDLGDSLGPIIRYEKDVVKLRRLVVLQRKRAIDTAIKRKENSDWAPRIIRQGAWDPIADPISFSGAPALPMPVQIAEPETLAPFFEHLALGGTEEKISSTRGVEEGLEVEEPFYGIKTLEFEKGVVYSDRRMDLCKMVLGPTNIGNLIESLKTNTFITHFLLGNNIIGPHGAKCISDFLESYPNRMDTWYLAGNCIDGDSFKLLVDGWVKSNSTTNIWLKRNPLGSTSADDVFRLITQASNLRTLDLDQTELGDTGVAQLFTKLADHAQENSLPLRHIYLNAVGISVLAAEAIAKYLSASHCELDSLYMTNNPLGNNGLKALAIGVKKNKSLNRLTLASAGASDEGIIALCESLEDHPGLTTLDIGQSFATPDLETRYNWITDRAAFAVLNLVVCSPQLAYLNLGQCAMTHRGLNTILDGVKDSQTLLYYFAKTIWPQEKSPAAVKAGQQYVKDSVEANNVLAANVTRKYGKDKTYPDFLSDEKRWLVNDMVDVRKIDSVYRNRDAGLARKGLKILDKWWDEDDETLKEVMGGAVGPFCTKQKKKVQGAVGPTCTMRKAKETVVV